MTLGEYIKYCPLCKENILTTTQIVEKKPCWNCQLKHAKEFKEKFGIDNIDERNNR